MRANNVVDVAMKRAHSAQVSLSESEYTNAAFEDGRLKSVESSQNTDLGVRVIKDGKLGSSRTTDLNDVEGVTQRAVETAEFGSDAHFEFAPASVYPKVEVFDKAVVSLTKSDLVAIGEEMVGRLRDYDPDIQVEANVWRGVGKNEIATSVGARATTESTSFGVSINGNRVRGTDILWIGDEMRWHSREIDHKGVAAKVVERFRLAETTVPAQSGALPVIFTPAGMRLLLLALTLGVNGKNVLLGSSPLKDRLGESIADARLTVTDNPLIDFAGGSSPYDGEAVPHQVLPLIEKGVLRSFVYDLDTAGRAGTRSTGHGPGCSPTNLIIEEGDTSYEAMLADTKQGLLVHDVLGLGQGNTISGAFSVNVHLAYKIENGKIAGRVKDVMLAGNAYDAFKNVEAIGNKAEWIAGFNGTYRVPYVKVGGLSIVAK